jgi:hypothetical protein
MLTADTTAVLIEILAATDAIWSPPRVFSNPAGHLPNPAWAALIERRQLFAAAGVDLVYSGTSSERNLASRRLAQLQSAGLVEVATHSGRRVAAKLTRRGDDIARWLAAEPLVCESWRWLRLLAALVEAGVSIGPQVREDDLARTDYGSADASRKLLDVETDLLPLKVAGLVADNSDANCRVWYSLTAAGELAATRRAPAMPRDLPAYRSADGWCARHSELFEAQVDERTTWRPEKTNLVVVPMSCGVGSERTWRQLDKSFWKRFAKRLRGPTNG